MAFDAELSPAGAQVLYAAALALKPADERRISDWVDLGEVMLTEKTNTPRPGPVTFTGVEYIREPLDKLHADDPAKRVTIRGGAQSAKSLVGQLWVCYSIRNNPKSFAIGLPSAGEIGKYNDFKLQPLIEDSPALKSRVRPVSTKANDGSSVRKKKLFNGASILLFNLASPKELQMISTGNLILEEVGNALKEVGARGNPIKQARERQAAYSVVGSKELMISTPSELGECEVTAAEQAGDQRRYYGKCPQCAGHFRFEPEGLIPPKGSVGAHFGCTGCGYPVEDLDRAAWRDAGVWVPTFRSDDDATNPPPPDYIAAEDIAAWAARDCEGREPSYYVWQAMCGLISLEKIADSVATAKTPSELKALEQQTYGRAWDPSVEAVSWEDLHRLREDYPAETVPVGAEVVTAFCDVQGAYLQWTAYAWGPGAEWWVVDRAIIAGDTSGDQVWAELDKVTRRTYPHAAGGELGIEAFGIDTGFRTHKVYGFVRGRANCYAMDGRPGWKLPILGKPKAVKVIENGRIKGRIKLWPSGTWELKSLLAWSLKISIEAGYGVRVQGRGHWSKVEDEDWARQVTAEYLREEKNPKTNVIDRWWSVISGRRNEETDCWVGARALAWSLGVGAARKDGQPGDALDWAAKSAERRPNGPQQDLFAPAHAMRTPPASPDAPPPPPAAPSKPRRFFK